MSWKQEFQTLRNKLIEKMHITEGALDKRVQRLVHKNSITPKTALVVLAKQQGIGHNRELQKLTSDERGSIKTVNASSVQATSNSSHASQNSNIKTYKTRSNTPNPNKKLIKPRTKSWHETWWGVALLGIAVTVVGGFILSFFI